MKNTPTMTTTSTLPLRRSLEVNSCLHANINDVISDKGFQTMQNQYGYKNVSKPAALVEVEVLLIVVNVLTVLHV